MKYCSTCGKEILDEAIICPSCGCAVVAPQVVSMNDNVSVGLCILSAFIPLFGFIYWPLNHKTTPKKAQACGITAICSFALCCLLLA